MEFFNLNNIIYNKQFGFREGSSTDHAVLEVVNEIADNMSNKITTCAIFLDLEKAFNTVNHSILLKKLEKYGVRGLPLKLMESYLIERKQVTKIGNCISEELNINTGVPQGSCLGPLLFVIYVNDLHLSTKFNVTLFADDACLSLSNENIHDLETETNNELQNVNSWLHKNKLFLNHNKTNYLVFSKKKTKFKFNIHINKHLLQEKTNIKYLGITIDNKLLWNKHLENLKTSLSKACYALWKLKPYADLTVLKSVYYSLFYSKLQYCVTSWGGCPGTNLEPIFRLQKRALRIMCSKPYTAPSNPLFVDMKMLKLNDIYRLNVCAVVRKFVEGTLIGDIELMNLNNKHNYPTRLRNNNNFYPQFPRTNLGKATFNYIGPKYWEDVPGNIKTTPTKLFKKHYKNFLINLYSAEQDS